jgi:hypothetical protein
LIEWLIISSLLTFFKWLLPKINKKKVY